MEEVTLNETETRYYSDLFLCCDVENTGKIPMLKAKELFHSSNVGSEAIVEITSLAGIPATALHISRAQFYSCLKLIAAHQAELPLRQELIPATVKLPLPRLNWKDATLSSLSGADCGQLYATNSLSAIPPPPPTDRRNSLQRRTEAVRRNSQQQQDAINSDVLSTDSEVEQNESSCGDSVVCGAGDIGGASGVAVKSSSSREMHRRRDGGVGSPEAWSTNSDSPTPTNSVAERPWAKDTLWHGLLGDEHRQLLGTEEESSDRHSSDDDDNESELVTIYQITPEQREYYYKQFKAVQRDPNGLLSGHAAKVFFEKSRIPVEELRHIWQLCDVTRDGALSLSEFTAAMHLVVLRRNNIPLPNVLPSCLHPNVLQHVSQQQLPQEPPEADLLHLNDDDDDEDNTDNTIIGTTINSTTSKPRPVVSEKNIMSLSTISSSSQVISTGTLTPPPLPPPVKNQSISNSPNMEQVTAASNVSATVVSLKENPHKLWMADVAPTQWTKFSESPTTTAATIAASTAVIATTTNVSSPGLKPALFDMKRTAQDVVSNPQILHPVPLRVTPVAGSIAALAANSGDYPSSNDDIVMLADSSPKQATQNVATAAPTSSAVVTSTTCVPQQSQLHRESLQNTDLRAIQRPQAKKLPVKNIGALPPPPQRESSIGSVGSGSGIISGMGVTGCGGGDAEIQHTQQQQQQLLFNKKEPPPLPPPRPHRHGRSSSLDLNKFKINTPGGAQQAEITAQASFDLQTSTGFADFTHFPEDGATVNLHDSSAEHQQHSLPPPVAAASAAPVIAQPAVQTVSALPPTLLSLQSNQRVSAFEVYRKPNTPRNSQSPTPPTAATALTQQSSQTANEALNTQHRHHSQQQQQHPQQPTQPPPPAPFGSGGATAIAQPPQTQLPTSTTTILPNADLFDKRVTAISETLRHVSFKQNDNNMPDILRRLREQNNLLLRLCNDLSDELLTVQTRREELRLKIESSSSLPSTAAATIGDITHQQQPPPLPQVTTRTVSSISAPVTANITGGSSGSSGGGHSNI